MLSGAEAALCHIHGDERQKEHQHSAYNGEYHRNQRDYGFNSINFVDRFWSRRRCGHEEFLTSINKSFANFTYTPGSAELGVKTGLA